VLGGSVLVVVGGPATSGWLGALGGRVGLSGTGAGAGSGCGWFLGEAGFDAGWGGPPVAFDTARVGSASVRGPWRVLGTARCGRVLGTACGSRHAGGGVTPEQAAPGQGTPTRVDSADPMLSGIAAAWRNGPVGVLRRTVSDTTPRSRFTGVTRGRPADIGRNGPGVLRRVISDTTPRIRSADATPPGIAAAGENAPVTARRRTTSGSTPAHASAVRRNGPVGVLRWQGWSRRARWG
jgi:hypothetical protein